MPIDISVNGQTYTESGGTITLPDYPNGAVWGNISGTVTAQTDLVDYVADSISSSIEPYATTAYVADSISTSLEPYATTAYVTNSVSAIRASSLKWSDTTPYLLSEYLPRNYLDKFEGNVKQIVYGPVQFQSPIELLDPQGTTATVIDEETQFGLNQDVLSIRPAGAGEYEKVVVRADPNSSGVIVQPTSAAANNSSLGASGYAWGKVYTNGISDGLTVDLSMLDISSGLHQASTAVQPASLTSALATKQDVIQDLVAIRSGASAGATAVQPESLTTALATKQNALINEVNIKSINGTTLLGSGSITVGADIDGKTIISTTAGLATAIGGYEETIHHAASDTLVMPRTNSIELDIFDNASIAGALYQALETGVRYDVSLSGAFNSQFTINSAYLEFSNKSDTSIGEGEHALHISWSNGDNNYDGAFEFYVMNSGGSYPNRVHIYTQGADPWKSDGDLSMEFGFDVVPAYDETFMHRVDGKWLKRRVARDEFYSADAELKEIMANRPTDVEITDGDGNLYVLAKRDWSDTYGYEYFYKPAALVEGGWAKYKGFYLYFTDLVSGKYGPNTSLTVSDTESKIGANTYDDWDCGAGVVTDSLRGDDAQSPASSVGYATTYDRLVDASGGSSDLGLKGMWLPGGYCVAKRCWYEGVDLEGISETAPYEISISLSDLISISSKFPKSGSTFQSYFASSVTYTLNGEQRTADQVSEYTCEPGVSASYKLTDADNGYAYRVSFDQTEAVRKITITPVASEPRPERLHVYCEQNAALLKRKLPADMIDGVPAPSNMVTTDTAQTITGTKSMVNPFILAEPNESYSRLLFRNSTNTANYLKINASSTELDISDSKNQGLTFKYAKSPTTGNPQGVSGGFYPDVSAAAGYTLGTASNKWKDLYLSGNVSDGSSSASISDVISAANAAQKHLYEHCVLLQASGIYANMFIFNDSTTAYTASTLMDYALSLTDGQPIQANGFYNRQAIVATQPDVTNNALKFFYTNSTSVNSVTITAADITGVTDTVLTIL